MGGPPQMTVDPDAISDMLPRKGDSQHALSIAKTGGDGMLRWQIGEDGRQPIAPASGDDFVHGGKRRLIRNAHAAVPFYHLCCHRGRGTDATCTGCIAERGCQKEKALERSESFSPCA